MWIKNDAIVARFGSGGKGGGVLTGGGEKDVDSATKSVDSAVKGSAKDGGSPSGAPPKSTKAEAPKAESKAESSKKTDAATVATVDTAESRDSAATGVAGDDSAPVAPAAPAATPAASAAPPAVGRVDEEMAKLRMDSSIAELEADIESQKLRAANAKKGQEQLRSAGKADAVDVAQDIGSSGMNLALGVSGLMLAAVFPPLAVPIIIGSAGFLAKGSFQGLNGIMGASEVVSSKVSNAVQSDSAKAARNMTAQAAGFVGKKGVQAAKGAAKGVGDAYNWATDRNAPDDREIKGILGRADGDPAKDYLVSSQNLSKSKEFKNLTSLLSDDSILRHNEIPKEERSKLVEELSKTLADEGKGGADPGDKLREFAAKFEKSPKDDNNKKRVGAYYAKVAKAARDLSRTDQYRDYVRDNNNFEQNGTKEDKAVISKYQKAAIDYGKRIASYQETEHDKADKANNYRNDADAFKEMYNSGPNNLQAFFEQEPNNAANVMYAAGIDIETVKKDVTGLKEDALDALEKAVGLKEKSEEKSPDGAAAKKNFDAELEKEDKAALEKAALEKAAKKGASVAAIAGKDIKREVGVDSDARSESVESARELRGEPSEEASQQKSDASSVVSGLTVNSRDNDSKAKDSSVTPSPTNTPPADRSESGNKGAPSR